MNALGCLGQRCSGKNAISLYKRGQIGISLTMDIAGDG